MSRKNKNKDITGKSVVRDLLDLLETVFISVFTVTLIFTYLFRISTVKGTSMQNTLLPDDRVITAVLPLSREPGDIVIVNADEAILLDDDGSLRRERGLNKQIVKRIIAVGGQTVDIDFERGTVIVDGVTLDEEYITGLTHLDEGAFTGKYPLEIPDGYVFVMGDNRTVSKDSRSLEVGLVSEDNIVGEVIFRLTPLDRFGLID